MIEKNKKRLGQGLICLVLVLAAGFYLHRFFAAPIDFEGDFLQNIYFELNKELVLADHNPYQWYYSSFMPFIGLNNPIQNLVSYIIGKTQLSPLGKAFFINFVTAWFLLSFLAIGIYFFLKKLNLSSLGSLLGAIVVSFTGFHSSVVKEFDHMYLLSLACVAPALYSQLRLCTSEKKGIWVISSAFWIGLSLLGGSNCPLFYYAPFFFLIPFIVLKQRMSLKERGLIFIYQFGSVILGVLTGAATLFPGIYFYSELNRGGGVFTSTPVTPKEKFISLFLRDWWHTSGYHYHEVDTFLGLPVIALFTLGLISFYKMKDKRLGTYFLILILLGITISNQYFLPSFIGRPIAFFFEKLSIFTGGRFFLLALIPIAYFCALGMDNLQKRKTTLAVLFFMAVNIILMKQYLLPNMKEVPPLVGASAFVSLTSAFTAGLLLLLSYFTTYQKGLKFFILVFTYGMYLYAPSLYTLYGVHYNKERDITLKNRKVSVAQVLGFNSQYEVLIEALKPYFYNAHPSLKVKQALRGRILDLKDTDANPRSNYFAPQTGHRFGFTIVKDASSPHRLQKILNLNNKAIFDMAGICSVTVYPYEILRERKECLPIAFFASTAVLSDTEEQILEKMKLAKVADFKKSIFLLRNKEAKDSELPSLQYNLSDFSEKPGKYEAVIESDKGGYFFVSTVYRPDWNAEINGTKVELLRANYAFMAVRLPAGKVKLELTLGNHIRIGALIFTGIMFLFLLITYVLILRAERSRHPRCLPSFAF